MLWLLRKCADVCKVVHLLRAAAPSIEPDTLEAYDAMLEQSLLRCLGGDLDEMSLEQASLGVAEGGLGLRRAAGISMPAYLASCIEARWMISLLADSIGDFVAPGVLSSGFEDKIARAQTDLERKLSPAGVTQMRAVIAEVGPAHQTPANVFQRMRAQREACLTGDALILPAGCEDPEFQPMGIAILSLCHHGSRKGIGTPAVLGRA